MALYTRYNDITCCSHYVQSVTLSFALHQNKWFTTNRHLLKPRDNVRYVPDIRNIHASVFSRDPNVLTDDDDTP